MTKEKIEEAYKIAREYISAIPTHSVDYHLKDIVQIGIQLALNNEVVYNEDGTVLRIE